MGMGVGPELPRELLLGDMLLACSLGSSPVARLPPSQSRSSTSCIAIPIARGLLCNV